MSTYCMPAMYDISRMRKRNKSRNDRLLFELIIAYRQCFLSSQKVSVNDFVVKAVALALKKVPQMNVVWDAAAGDAIQLDKVDISVAVATENGLAMS